MGRTIPSFRMLLNAEIARWREFRSKLSKEDRKAFDELMNSSKLHSSAASCSLRTNVFEALCMAIILDRQKTLENIASKLESINIGEKNEEV
ncbi:MAG: hypothetical protein HMLIMOIP_000228 [Candidatus Nitrosomirales archaeon]|jgi:hypothetical protein